MGKLRAILDRTTNKSKIVECLETLEFEYTNFVCGSNMGYQKCIPTDDNLYYLWIHCDLENHILNLYKEYNCGGGVGTYCCEIPNKLIVDDNPNTFIEWLDGWVDCYLS